MMMMMKSFDTHTHQTHRISIIVELKFSCSWQTNKMRVTKKKLWFHYHWMNGEWWIESTFFCSFLLPFCTFTGFFSAQKKKFHIEKKEQKKTQYRVNINDMTEFLIFIQFVVFFSWYCTIEFWFWILQRICWFFFHLLVATTWLIYFNRMMMTKKKWQNNDNENLHDK